MAIFQNFIFVFIFVGVITRILHYFLLKKVKKSTAAYLTFGIIGVILVPIASIFIGWDVIFTEYVGSLVIWLLFDILRSGEKV